PPMAKTATSPRAAASRAASVAPAAEDGTLMVTSTPRRSSQRATRAGSRRFAATRRATGLTRRVARWTFVCPAIAPERTIPAPPSSAGAPRDHHQPGRPHQHGRARLEGPVGTAGTPPRVQVPVPLSGTAGRVRRLDQPAAGDPDGVRDHLA